MRSDSHAKNYLRSLKSLVGTLPTFDLREVASTPEEQFFAWLEAAIEAGVQEPHAMTLSTVDERGSPDARVLILKNLDEHGWHFAISSASPKGQQLLTHPQAALTFYWPRVARQIRVRGTAKSMSAEVNAADFLARPEGSRASALTARQSEVFTDPAELDQAFTEQFELISRDPTIVAPAWTVFALQANQVEFWQGDSQRRHTRLRYRNVAGGWTQERLWP